MFSFFVARGRNLYMMSRQTEVMKEGILMCSMHVVLKFMHRAVF